jgi:tRNA(fMet)-specific endonuclease VapC
MEELLLDTDVLSEVLKGFNVDVASHARRYLFVHSRFTFSHFTKYQVLRGLKRKSATAQQRRFLNVAAKARILPIDDAVIERAAQLWAEAMNNGKPADDADLLIAATALEHDLTLCTGNTHHFNWIPGLRLVNWKLP